MRGSRARRPCCSTRRCWPASAAASSRPASSIPRPCTRAVEEFRRFRALSDQAGAGAALRASRPRRPARPRTAWTSSTAPKRSSAPRSACCRGREEAHYSALGVISGFHPANGIAGDLGGGSLELVDVNGEAIGDGITLPLGGLRLQDMAKNSLAAAAKIAREQLARAKLLKGGAGQGLLCRRRHLAKPRPAAHERHQLSAGGHAPLRAGHRKLGRLPAPGRRAARSTRSRASKASRRAAARCCPMARSCCRRSSRRCSRRRSSSRRSACARASSIRCCRPRSSGPIR